MTVLTLLAITLAVALIVSIILNYQQKRKLNKTLCLLALQNQNLMLAIRAGNIAVWGYDVKQGHLYNIEGEVFPGDKGATIAEGMAGVHPDDCDEFARVLQGVVNGEMPSETICIRFKNMYTGEWEYIEKEFALIRSRSGEVETVIGTHKDVTKRVSATKQIDELLKKYQYLYKENHTILNSLPTGVSIYDKEGKIVYVNQMLCDLLEVKDRDLILDEANTLWNSYLFGDEVKNRIRRGENAIFNYQLDYSQLPVRHFTPSDKVLHISCTSSFVKNERSEIESYIFIHRDTTREYNHQLELEESKLKTELAIQVSDMVQWEYDVNKRLFHTWNERTETDILTPEDYYQVTHPDDQQKVLDIIAFMDSRNNETFEFDTRFKFPSDDEWQYIKVTGTPLMQDKDGAVIKYTGFQRNNTQWQNLTEELKSTNEMNKLILDNMRSGLAYLSADRKVIWENASDKFSLDFTNGVPLFEVDKLCRQTHLGINKSCQTCTLDNVWEKRESLTTEKTLDNGNVLEIEGNPIIDDKNNLSGIILRIDDISERKRLYKELEASRNDALSTNQLLREILSRMPGAIFIKDMDDNYRYLLVNSTFSEIWGVSEEDVIGKTDFDIMDHELAKTYRMNDERVIAGRKPIIISEETQTEKGVYQCWKTIKSAFTSINNRQLLIGMAVDISEIRKANDELQKAKNKAEESDKLKSAFLANISHEIRTPLNSIIGFSGLLKDSNDEDEKNEFWNIINTNNELLLRLINDILDLSKIEAGAIELKSAKFNLTARFDEIYSTLKLRNKNKEVEFKCDNPYHKCIIDLDESRITQIITNFATNALKFTPKGQIKMGYEFADGQLRLYCTDTGIGIAPEKIDKIFTRFSKMNDFAQGTGLGTAICKAIVDAYGGEIGVDSVINKGSTFWACIPCEAEIKEDFDIEL